MNEVKIIDDFCRAFRLEGYRVSVEKIVKKIISTDCKISIHNSGKVKAEYQAEIKCIFINANFGDEGINMIWRLLHEFGHHQDSKYPRHEILNREQEAWRIAESELKELEELIEFEKEFYTFRDLRLTEYRERLKIQHPASE